MKIDLDFRTKVLDGIVREDFIKKQKRERIYISMEERIRQLYDEINKLDYGDLIKLKAMLAKDMDNELLKMFIEIISENIKPQINPKMLKSQLLNPQN